MFEPSNKRIIVYIFYIIIITGALFLFNINVKEAYAQDDRFPKKITKLADTVYMLEGFGGNILVSVGKDGVFIVDDGLAPLTEKIKAAISKITNQPIKFVINTHWHSDHAGGNENLGELGAIIISHDNVRKRLSTEQFMQFKNKTFPALLKTGLPTVTFSDNMTLYQNGDEIKIIHLDGHTDGDSVIYFTKNNIIHMGDEFSDKAYPFIDISSNGTIDGLISSLKTISSIINDKTIIVSGHTGISNKTKVIDFSNMLQDVRDQISQMINEGKSLTEIITSNPTSKYDKIYYYYTFIKPENFVTHIYQSLMKDLTSIGVTS